MRWARVRMAWGRETDIASLVVFRGLFGVLLVVSCVRFVAKGYLRDQLITPTFHFTYAPLSFVKPLPAPLMTLVFAVLTVSACCIAIGFAYRTAVISFLCLFTYVELIDQANYLNHYYLVSLLCFLMALLPLDRAFSVRAGFWGVARVTLPAYALWAMRAQVAVVYVFAGVAKLNSDWLIAAQPLSLWLGPHQGIPWIGPWLASSATAHVASIAGAVFDLAIVPGLLHARTRLWAMASALVFHALTGLLFPVGMFPWIMSVCLTLFLPPNWPRFRERPQAESRRSTALRARPWLLGGHTAIQICIPLYAHLVHRDAAWTGRGFDFAWRVMVAERVAAVEFTMHTPDGGASRVALDRHLTPLQQRAVAQDPVLLCAFARHLAQEAHATGSAVRITARAHVSLNGRPSVLLVDPNEDLARAEPYEVVLPGDVQSGM